MSIKTFTFLLILAFAWTSCKNDAATSGTTQSEPTTTEAATATEPGVSMGDDPNKVFQSTSTIDPAATTTQPAGAAGTAGIKNPAHGQPGHVCGVPVGQVLDGKTATAPTTVVPNMAAPKPAAAPAAGNATAPGMNPPHGQPGHRCDISVGEPLNSKPKQ